MKTDQTVEIKKVGKRVAIYKGVIVDIFLNGGSDSKLFTKTKCGEYIDVKLTAIDDTRILSDYKLFYIA